MCQYEQYFIEPLDVVACVSLAFIFFSDAPIDIRDFPINQAQ